MDTIINKSFDLQNTLIHLKNCTKYFELFRVFEYSSYIFKLVSGFDDPYLVHQWTSLL